MTGFGSQQCKICEGWFHYAEDRSVCRKCYNDFKQFEIYGHSSKFSWEEE